MQERVPSDHAGTEQSKDATAVMNIDSANLSPIHVFSLVLSFCPDFQGVETTVNVLVAPASLFHAADDTDTDRKSVV